LILSENYQPTATLYKRGEELVKTDNNGKNNKLHETFDQGKTHTHRVCYKQENEKEQTKTETNKLSQLWQKQTNC